MGRKTIELQHISKSYGDRTLISDFTYSALRNDRLGIVGENGCGKSTLLKIIQGLVAPDTGSVAIGDTIQIGYFAQECRELEEVSQNEKVIDYIRDTAEFIETSTGTASASQMLERFLFTGAMQWTPIYKLSGGEKRRLYLLKVLMTAPNVLILDEPTNDLDIATLTILEDFLNSFQGIVITVSHDRYFLDNVADRILAFEAGGVIRQYDGNYSDYLEKSGYVPGNLRKNPEESPTLGQKPQASAKDTWKVKEERPKFSYKEQREYDTIEDEIGSLEERLSEIDAAMLEHASNYGRLNELTQEKEALEEELLVKMERWEYLSELAERIEEYKKNK
jgi:ATP-binding cassette subfamily F protein uup